MTHRQAKQALARINREVVACTRCPRLVAYRQRIGREKRRAFRDQTYWAKPVPGFGDPEARLVVVGLAPAAHGANRTGRMFTGDRSGEWLYRALFRAGFANQPTSVARNDGLELRAAYITAAARCAPPENKPTPTELAACMPFLVREIEVLLRANAAPGRPLVIVALGSIAFTAVLRVVAELGVCAPRPRPRFAHAAEITLSDAVTLLASYHPSQQNTQTGRLTEAMLDAVFTRARELIAGAAVTTARRRPRAKR